MHLLYAAYDEAFEILEADRANAPICTECPAHSLRHLCPCGNWFCDHCGLHIEDDIDKATGNVCWAGAA